MNGFTILSIKPPVSRLGFRLLSMAISRYDLFLCQIFMIHLCCLFVCVVVYLFCFLHLYCSAQLSMFNMEKCYRNHYYYYHENVIVIVRQTCW